MALAEFLKTQQCPDQRTTPRHDTSSADKK